MNNLKQILFKPKFLPNGLKILSNFQEGETACIGLYINAGSRFETSSNNGVSHFLEHMYFKGTQNSTMDEIEQRMEHTGSVINAYTTREYQCFTVHGLACELELSISTLADMILNPLIEKSEIERERRTIVREFEEVNRTIDEYFFEYLHEVCYPNNPLGYSILGPLENIENSITKEEMENFRDQFYNANNMLLLGFGNIDEDIFFELGQKYFSSMPSHNKHLDFHKEEPIFNRGKVEKINLGEVSDELLYTAITYDGPGFNNMRDSHMQTITQIMFGFFDIFYQKSNYKTDMIDFLLKNDDSIMQIYPYCFPYSDRSLFGIQICNNGNINTNNLILEIINKMNKFEVNEEQLQHAKYFMINQMLMYYQVQLFEGLDEIGRSILFLNDEEMTLQNYIEDVESITTDDMKEFWNRSFANPAILLGGNVENIHLSNLN